MLNVSIYQHLKGEEMKADLKDFFQTAAIQADKDGVDAGDEQQLINWIRFNCNYSEDHLFFLVLLIGSALADIQAQAQGFKHEVHRALESAKAAFEDEKIQSARAAAIAAFEDERKRS